MYPLKIRYICISIKQPGVHEGGREPRGDCQGGTKGGWKQAEGPYHVVPESVASIVAHRKQKMVSAVLYQVIFQAVCSQEPSCFCFVLFCFVFSS